jgi:hypothetical protein
MIRLFPEFKRFNVDGFRDPHDYRDPYEIYFGLFGRGEGDGGPSGGNDERQEEKRSGTTFGVDGRSKTGSTEKDREVGFTDGAGNRGRNFDALDKATTEQTATAVAAADAAKAAGASERAGQRAVANALGGYQEGAVNKSGGLSDTGKSLVAKAVESAIKEEEEAIQQELAVADELQRLAPSAISGVAPATTSIGLVDDLQKQLATAQQQQKDYNRRQFEATKDLAGSDYTEALRNFKKQYGGPNYGRQIQDLQRQIDAARKDAAERLAAADQLQAATSGALSPAEQLNEGLDDLTAADQLQAATSGALDQDIQFTPEGFEQLGTLVTADLLQEATSGAQPPAAGAQRMFRPSAAEQLAAADQLQAATSGAQPSAATAAAEAAAAGSGTLSPAEQLNQQVQGLVAASPRTPEQQAGVTPAGPMGAQAALGTPAENFYADAYRELNPQIETIPGTTAAGIVGGITNLFGGDAPTAEDQAAFQSGQMMSLPGSEMDPATGAITAPAGQGELNMNRFGMVTYSGMPDPNYSGPFSDLVNPSIRPEGSGDSLTAVAAQQTQVDPCPAGYELDPATQKCVPIDVVDDQQFSLGRRQYGPSETPSLIGTPVSPFPSPTLQPTAPNMGFLRPAVNPFGFARGGIVELPKK